MNHDFVNVTHTRTDIIIMQLFSNDDFLFHGHLPAANYVGVNT